MSHFGNYMDGVPVKISEKYKKPPQIELPYSVKECSSRVENILKSSNYSVDFENNVLSKLKELRAVKETKKTERKHRLQLLEEEKQKRLDAIACAEAEENFKQLNVSDVSYPEEISATETENKTECDRLVSESDNNQAVIEPPMSNVTQQDTLYNILQPIQMQPLNIPSNLLDDPDPLEKLKINCNLTKRPKYQPDIDKLTFEDFENDTSSPFDNIELKTINDMELLAQVLQVPKDTSPNSNMQYLQRELPSSSGQCQTSYLQNYTNSVQTPANIYDQTQYPIANGYYIPANNICDMTQKGSHVSNYQYYVPTNPYPPETYNQTLYDADQARTVHNGYIPQPYFYYNKAPVQYPTGTDYVLQNIDNNKEICNSSVTNENETTIAKSRSRSVPDIVKELDEELKSVKERFNERSCNASPANVDSQKSFNINEKNSSKNKQEVLFNPYDKLSMTAQSICRNIHSMGFPLDRVARVCFDIGDDDKKIVEVLLAMGDLLDLGFSESLILKALRKNEFNKEKALDELIS